MAVDSDSPLTRQVTLTTGDITKTFDCLEPWLDDGNIVLVVQEKCFRVHRTILGSYSEVFKDMFSIPHHGDTEEDVIDECPIVYLQDTADDVQIMLWALYDRSFVFFYSTPMSVSVLGAFLRMGKKYGMQQLFEEAKRRLALSSPPLLCASKLSATGDSTLFPRISGNDPFNFKVIDIASEAGLFSALAVAIFYCCLACPATSIANGYEFAGERITLSASGQRYCILGQRYLADVDRRMVQTLSHYPGNCMTRSVHSRQTPCTFTILALLHSFQELKCPFTLWVPSWDEDLCSACRGELRRKHEEMRTKLWKKLPVALGLGTWEDLEKEPEVSQSSQPSSE